MAHILLGFQKYSTEAIAKLQRKLTAEGNVNLGRDADKKFSHFNSENSAVRLIRMASMSNGNERCGIRDKWLTDCYRRKIKSVFFLFYYKDNRFIQFLDVLQNYVIIMKILSE